MRHTLYYTQRNMGKFVIAETKAPNGYFGDWTNIDHPGTANTPLGKRGYYIEITEDKDNSVIWLDNATTMQTLPLPTWAAQNLSPVRGRNHRHYL